MKKTLLIASLIVMQSSWTYTGNMPVKMVKKGIYSVAGIVNASLIAFAVVGGIERCPGKECLSGEGVRFTAFFVANFMACVTAYRSIQ